MVERATDWPGHWPFFVAPTYGQVRASHYPKRFQAARRIVGGNSRQLLEANEIDAIALESHDYPLNNARVTEMLESCAAMLGDSLFGIHLAEGLACSRDWLPD